MKLEYHNPVLLESCIKYLLHDYKGTYVDCTFGGGGHSKAFLNNLDKNAKLVAFDCDQDTIKNLLFDDRFIFINKNFRYLKKYLYLNNIYKVDGIFADFGVSSYQIDNAHKGFSIRFNGPLNMKMDSNQDISAFEVVNTYKEKKLIKILMKYGELKHAKQIARKICIRRSNNLIQTTDQLKNIFNYMPKHKINKILAKIFQAIRIEVNDELNAIKELLLHSLELLNPKGRLVMISYHSLEDRLIKNFFKTGCFNGDTYKDMFGNSKYIFKYLIKKPIMPNLNEFQLNSRSRSAKLRAVEMI